MTWQLIGGVPLINGGSIAIDPDCCCDTMPDYTPCGCCKLVSGTYQWSDGNIGDVGPPGPCDPDIDEIVSAWVYSITGFPEIIQLTPFPGGFASPNMSWLKDMTILNTTFVVPTGAVTYPDVVLGTVEYRRPKFKDVFDQCYNGEPLEFCSDPPNYTTDEECCCVIPCDVILHRVNDCGDIDIKIISQDANFSLANWWPFAFRLPINPRTTDTSGWPGYGYYTTAATDPIYGNLCNTSVGRTYEGTVGVGTNTPYESSCECNLCTPASYVTIYANRKPIF